MINCQSLASKVISRYIRDGGGAWATSPDCVLPHFFEQGNFVVCVLQRGDDLYVGVAKRNPCDKFSKDTGENVALARAYRSFLKDMAPKD